MSLPADETNGPFVCLNSAQPEQSTGETGLFPLRLSDFEYYMFLDDRPSHPMVFVMTVHVSGRLERSAFETSLAELLKTQPLLRCRIERSFGKGWCWVPLESMPNVLEWTECQNPAAFVPVVRGLEITRQPGICVLVAAGEQSSQVVLYLHHACCDGIGALQLIGELFARYGQKTAAPGQKKPELCPVDAQVLRHRENYEVGEAATTRQKKSLRRMIGKISRLLFRRPVCIAGTVPKPGSPNQGDSQAESAAIQSHVLGKPVHRALRAVATAEGVSLNDLFLREMVLHIRSWNQRAGRSMGSAWIRIGVPLSMRTARHNLLPASNVVSYALITRCEQDCLDPAALLTSIHRQTSDVLYHREGIVCLKLFRILRKLPGAMWLFLHLKSVLSTMVLANVGDIRRRFGGRFPLLKGRWVAGNVVIEQIHGVAPVRPNTHAAMSIGDYAGDLTLSLRTDSQVLDSADSVRFMNEYLERLMTLARGSGLPSHMDSNQSVHSDHDEPDEEG